MNKVQKWTESSLENKECHWQACLQKGTPSFFRLFEGMARCLLGSEASQ